MSKKYSIQISYETRSENPRESWDCQCPLLTYGGRDFGDKNYGIDIIDFIRSKTNKNNIYKIAKILGYSKDDVKSRVDKYLYYTCYSVVEDLVAELDNPDDVESILNILKVRNYRRTSRGYSQGECINCIIVYTDDYIKEIGIKKKDISDAMKGDKKLFDAWAWGDVYSYQVIEHKELYDKDGNLSSVTDDEVVDSCCGFYGYDELEKIKSEVAVYGITDEQFESAKENIK